MFKFIEVSEGAVMNFRLQEHPPDCLLSHIKGKAKQATEFASEVLSVLCEYVVWRSPLQSSLEYNCLVIVIVYAKDMPVHRRITKKQVLLFIIHQVVNSGIQNCANSKEF